MKGKWIRIAAACALAAVLLTTPAFASTIGGATVTGSNVRLRSSATTQTAANIITEMQKGTFLLVEEKEDGWYKVVWNGTEGYVSADYASFSETAEGTYRFDSATKGTEVNLRTDATTASAVVKNLKQSGTALTVTGVKGQWLKVTDALGDTGYIRSDLMNYKRGGDSSAAQTTAAAATLSLSFAGSVGESIVQTALKYKGYAYRWGGTSPATGFDCSGFANYVCSQNGVSLHRTAQEVYSNDGTWVGKDDLQPGDLLFFGYSASCVTHMGIYVGDGQMIHASTSATGVILSDINSDYYTRMYVGAKRVA